MPDLAPIPSGWEVVEEPIPEGWELVPEPTREPVRHPIRTPVQGKDWGTRPDGTPKGSGYLGPLQLPGGGVASEYSVGVNIEGREMDIPTLVPTLTSDERERMVNDIIPSGKMPPDTIIQKAVDHARQRLGQGKSVFQEQATVKPEAPAEMERDWNQLRSDETTLEYKQRMAIARGDDPSKETPTASASARDEAILNSRPEYVARQKAIKEFEDKISNEIQAVAASGGSPADVAQRLGAESNPEFEKSVAPTFEAFKLVREAIQSHRIGTGITIMDILERRTPPELRNDVLAAVHYAIKHSDEESQPGWVRRTAALAAGSIPVTAHKLTYFIPGGREKWQFKDQLLQLAHGPERWIHPDQGFVSRNAQQAAALIPKILGASAMGPAGVPTFFAAGTTADVRERALARGAGGVQATVAGVGAGILETLIFSKLPKRIVAQFGGERLMSETLGGVLKEYAAETAKTGAVMTAAGLQARLAEEGALALSGKSTEFADAFKESIYSIPDTAFQAALFHTPTLARGAKLSLMRKIRSKGWVTTAEGKALGLSEEEMTNRETRKAAVDQRIQQAEQEIQDASEVREDQGVPEEAGEVGQRGEADRVGDLYQRVEEPIGRREETPTRKEEVGGPEAPVRPVETREASRAPEPLAPSEVQPQAEQRPESAPESTWVAETRERLAAVPAFEGSAVEMDEAAGTARITRPDGRTTTVHLNEDAKLAELAKRRGVKGAKGAYVYKRGKKGEFQEGDIYIRSDAGHDTLNHEAIHWLEDEGVVTPKEVAKYGGREGLARKYGTWAAAQQRKPDTLFQRIYDFLEPIFSSQRRLFEDIGRRGVITEPAAEPAPAPEAAPARTRADFEAMHPRELGEYLGKRWVAREKSVLVDQAMARQEAEARIAQRGVSGEASKPLGRPDIEQKPGAAAGAMLQPVQMPELFQLAKDLMEGKIPQVKKLRGAAGRFKGQEGIGPLSILIDPTTAKDEQALAQTMAHEIGHLVDFLPENTLRRGNLLGRLQSLRNFLKSTMPPLEKSDQAKIRRQAVREAGKGATSEQIGAIQQRMLKDAGLLANKTIRDELIDLTKWWSGDYTGGETSYAKYRESSRELYAEALSVFLNSPGDLESRAPTFYKALLDNLDSKPDVLEAYLTLQQTLNGTGQELAKSRTQILREMFGRAEEHINNLRIAREQQRKSVWSGITDFLGQYFLTSAQPMLTKLGRKPIKRGESAEAEAARFALDELFTIDSPNHTFLRNLDEQTYQPLIETMQKRGLDRRQAEEEANFTLGEYLYHWRVANERDAIANPAGFTAAPSTAQLEAIRMRIGNDAYSKLQEYAQRFHDLVYTIAEEAANEGVYNRKLFDEVITPNKDNYAAFRVTHYIDDPDIIATGVIQQVGTFSDVQNPFHATVLKAIRLNRLVELNRAKNRVRQFLEKSFPNGIAPVEMVFAGEGRPRIPRKRPGKGKEHLIELVDGHPAYFEVPSEIAKSFSMHDIGGLGRIASFINSATYKIFHPFFVTYNPGFVLANPFRDLRRTWVNLGATDDISLGRLLYEWGRALPVAFRREMGIEDTVIREMIDSHAMDIPYTSVAAEDIDSQIDQLFQRYGLREKRETLLEKIPVVGKALKFIEHAGAMTETATKVAGWRVLEEKGVPVQERSYRVRKYVGTPDYKQRGLATALTNSLMMYSRVRWNGWQADIGLATKPDTAAGWWWRQTLNVIVPTTFAKFAAYGGFGYVLRAMFGVSEDDDESTIGKIASWTGAAGKLIAKYFLTDYDVIPLGVNQDGKAVFITIPRDDVGKFLARVWWHALDLVQLGAGQELKKGESARNVLGNMLTDTKEELIPSFSPPIEITSKWLQYGSGINPVDSFYNQQIIPEKEWTAGGWQSDSKMIAWTLDEFGAPGALIHYPLSPLLGESFETGTSGGVEAVMKTAGAMTGLKRFLRISDSGLTSEQWAMLENADQEAAAFRLSLPDSAQRASTRRYFLTRRESLGDALSKKEQDEMHGLNLFYNAAYIPLRKTIQEAEDAGEDSTQLRDDMKRAADDPMALWQNPPESIAKPVASYRQGVVMAAVKQPPDPKKYTPEAYKEKLGEYKKSLEASQVRLKFFGLTHTEAQQLLVEYYRRKGEDEYVGKTTKLQQGYIDRATALAKLYGKSKPKEAWLEFYRSPQFKAWSTKWFREAKMKAGNVR